MIKLVEITVTVDGIEYTAFIDEAAINQAGWQTQRAAVMQWEDESSTIGIPIGCSALGHQSRLQSEKIARDFFSSIKPRKLKKTLRSIIKKRSNWVA